MILLYSVINAFLQKFNLGTDVCLDEIARQCEGMRQVFVRDVVRLIVVLWMFQSSVVFLSVAVAY